MEKKTRRKQRAKFLEHTCSKQRNKDTKARQTVSNLHATAPPAEMLFQNVQNPSKPQKNEDNAISMIKSFHNNIKCGPEYICTCCDQRLHRTKSSVTELVVSEYLILVEFSDARQCLF